MTQRLVNGIAAAGIGAQAFAFPPALDVDPPFALLGAPDPSEVEVDIATLLPPAVAVWQPGALVQLWVWGINSFQNPARTFGQCKIRFAGTSPVGTPFPFGLPLAEAFNNIGDGFNHNPFVSLQASFLVEERCRFFRLGWDGAGPLTLSWVARRVD